MERKFHGSESYLYGLFAPGNESAEERKGLESSEYRISDLSPASKCKFTRLTYYFYTVTSDFFSSSRVS